jgi:uncharacterized protein YbaA (DUF1428 family)
MSKSNGLEADQDTGGRVMLFVYRTPKKNHDAMMRVNKQSVDLFRKFGVRLEPFQLTSIEAMMDFTNIAKTVSANQDEEVWLELQFYRDQKHLEDVMAKMEHDEIGPQLFREFMGLVTQGSSVIMGDFSSPMSSISFLSNSNMDQSGKKK